MMKDLVSIIIPVFNHQKELLKCLESCLKQTYKNIEIIVVDDGSEKSIVLPKEFGEIKIIRQENKGAPSARNRGFDESHGEFIIFCDADIIMNSTMIKKMVNAIIKNNSASFVYSSFKFGFKTFKCGGFNSEKLKQLNYIHTTSLIRRTVFPRFDESLKRFQDWDLWLTISLSGCFGIFISEVLFKIKPRRLGMSKWLPKFAYRFSWLDEVKKYKAAEKIIREKHCI